MRFVRRLLPALVVLALAVLPAHAATKQVAIRNLAYQSPTVTVAPGDSVTWTNHDAVNHTVTGENDLTLRSTTMEPNETYDHTFLTAGTFTYRCDFHPSMQGTVVVQAGGPTSTSSTTITDDEDATASERSGDEDPSNAGPAALAALLLAAVSGSAALAVRKGL
jgi:plastocyanin